MPMARAAIRRRVPLVLLEQNAVPGRATRYLARAATLICTVISRVLRASSPACDARSASPGIRSGRIRKAQGLQLLGFRRPQRQLVILGGSGGAQTLNETMPRALDRLRSLLPVGGSSTRPAIAGFQQTRDLYRTFRIEATVVPFIADVPGGSGRTGMSSLPGQTGMSGLLAESDLAVCRAGGTTLAELAAAGVPAILVPYPHAADDHQRKNAEALAAAGACLIDRPARMPRLLGSPLGRRHRGTHCRSGESHRHGPGDPSARAAERRPGRGPPHPRNRRPCSTAS